MFRNSVPFFFLLLVSNVAAREYLPVGEIQYLIADQVHLRKAPAETSASLATLSAGQEVRILSQTEQQSKIGGVEAPWFGVQSGTKKGYVWGPLIARNYVRRADGTLFMYGIGFSGNPESHRTRVRLLRNGKSLADLIVNQGAGFDSEARVTLGGSRGFSGIESIFVVAFQQEYCAGVGNKLFFFYDGKSLTHVHSSVEGSDAPVYASEDQVFPDQKGGRPNQILIQREEGDHDDSKSVVRESFWLKWDGKRLIKL
ncbi:MAG: SH3 domain-containing protein [Spirochaetales bacterium]|nr:SH3 domain-containing protein [Spirochaetales bacterium]